MPRFYSISLILMILVAIAACKKDPVQQPVVTEETGNANAVIVNQVADSVYLTLSGHDIATGTQPHIISITLPPSDTLIIPRADLKNAYRYQYDWHTADYTYSNWFMANAGGKVPELLFDYYADSTDYALVISGTKRNELLICLNGTGLSSSWVAVDAYDATGASVWSSLTDREKAHKFTISRFHTSKHLYTDTFNKSVTTHFSFSLDISQPRMWLQVIQPLDSYVITNNFAPTVQLATSAMDTLFYSRVTTDSTGKAIYPQPYYKIARQSIE